MTSRKSTYRHWLSERIDSELGKQAKRLLHAKDVKHLRLMADAHLANDVCVGCVMATSHLLYPAAVGGDIGCGMLSVPIDSDADFIGTNNAREILNAFEQRIPIIKHKHTQCCDVLGTLSNPKLQQVANRDGRRQLGTLGRGNHFVELQACYKTNQLWLMIHTGSRVMGPTIRDFYLSLTSERSAGIGYLDLNSELGQAYFSDMQWARDYARLNRLLILKQCKDIFKELFSLSFVDNGEIHCDHNHIEKLDILGQSLLIHRKGASSVRKGEPAIIPGSMGSDSFHVTGLGNSDSLCSSSHGAGRCMSRQKARNTITTESLSKQLSKVFYQPTKLHLLTEEAPASYKRIETVMNLQKKLVKTTRRLRPVLSFKGT